MVEASQILLSDISQILLFNISQILLFNMIFTEKKKRFRVDL